MIKIYRKNLNKNEDSFYVVTRSGRRVEEQNYTNRSDAELRAAKLLNMVQQYSPHEKDTVSIVHTCNPYKIR